MKPAMLVVLALAAADPCYKAEIEKWRQEREAGLRADDGWLTVTGLDWLKEGSNVVEPGAVFDLHAGQVTHRPRSGTPVAMRPDTQGEPTMIRLGDLTMHVIERGGRYGIRVKDKNSRFRKEFSGLHWYAVDERYRVTARFVPYNPPKVIAVPNVLGQTTPSPSPGYAEFTLSGRQFRLEPITEGDQLFFIFKDRTSGKETYPAGRFLYADMPKGGKVVLDFNKAYSPPCAFTPYATCPLPPKQNQLAVAVEAGEKNPHH